MKINQNSEESDNPQNYPVFAHSAELEKTTNASISQVGMSPIKKKATEL
jgi:hypothetical protein